MGIVTISASYGAGGPEVGPAVAERLGLDFHDRAIPVRVAGRLGVSTDDDGVAEMKRVYVAPGFRRRGLAQVVVAELERTARRAGYRAFVLNSGDRQPEALALYTALGYRPVPGYGVYADGEGAVFLGKDLTDGERTDGEVAPWAS